MIAGLFQEVIQVGTRNKFQKKEQIGQSFERAVESGDIIVWS